VISRNRIFNAASIGIRIEGSNTLVADNEVYGCGSSAIYVNVGGGSSEDAVVVRGNLVHDNPSGLYLLGLFVAVGNTVYKNTTGLLVLGSYYTTEARDNLVYDYVTGITGIGFSAIAGNRVYHNSGTGIEVDNASIFDGNPGTISDNVVYSNRVGIKASS